MSVTDLGEDTGPVVAGDHIEQAASVCRHACGAGDGMSPGEGLTRLPGRSRVAGDRRESAERKCARQQRGHIPVREG